MKQYLYHYLRLIGVALLIAVLLGLVVLGLGWLRKWNTPIQYSNGFFAAGAISIVLGLFSVMGGFSMRSDFKVLYSQSAGAMNLAERGKLWMADITQGYGSLILLSLTGALLVGVSIFVGRLSG